MKLHELIEAVKEEELTKTQLEQYHTEITYLDNLYRMELAPIEKEEAKFFMSNKYYNHVEMDGQIETIERPDIVVKRIWKDSPQGQRQIELSHYLKVTPKLLQSIKTRLYNIY